MTWAIAAPAITAAFLASLVEAVEALTVVLAVASVRGWRSAGLGAASALVALAALVALFGPLLTYVPLHTFQFAIGILLLLFGMRWLRKAILRASGLIALHDETKAFASASEELKAQAEHEQAQLDRVAWATSFQAVMIEGLEVVFIVLAVGVAHQGILLPASAGAFAACALVALAGVVVHRPLARVPENALKFVVGIMLSSFGLFWIGEGIGIPWPGSDLAILGFILLFALTSAIAVTAARTRKAQAS